MKFSLEWLRDFLETDASAEELAATMTRIGLEVEGLDDPAERLAGFRIARVLEAAPHPDADRLRVLSVDAGDGEPLQVVCGAPNARAGMSGVLGLPGATVPSNGMELRVSTIRGVESNGMMCSARELGLGDEHDGILDLADAPDPGTPYADFAGASPVFDVAITPNRPDCMGVHGIARDLAAAGIGTLKPLDLPAIVSEGAPAIEVRIEDHEGCPAFWARTIRGVTNGASPDWLRRRLESAGQRPISTIVDLTNWLMLSFGRPAHVYDLAKLKGPIVARRARAGETVTALNGKDYALDESMTVIADANGVHDIAGIMGGKASGVTEATSDVLLEIAWFDPASIGVTGRKLGLASDARTRFERGVDPEFLDAGLDLLTDRIVALCGGQASEAVRVGSPPDAWREVPFDMDLTERLGGVPVPPVEQRAILERLGFALKDGPDDWLVAVPPRRHDIEGPADLVEEVVRIHGLDRVESVALPRPGGVAPPTATHEQALERRLRRAAAARGMNEAITWSFLPVADAEHFAAPDQLLWLLDNPISEEMRAMRPSLLPGLVAAAARGAARGASSARLFEIGRRYLRGKNGTSDERPTLALLLAGERGARGWRDGKAQTFDAFDAKAEALALLGEAGAPVDRLMVGEGAGPQFHPGRSATLRLGPKTVLARFGELHPATLDRFDMPGPAVAAELFLDALPRRKQAGFARPPFAPPALQAVTRDFAFLVPAELPAADLERAGRGADKRRIVAVRVFDVFAGQGVPEGRKSLAVEVTLQPGETSFTDAELEEVASAVIGAAAKLGAELRG